MSPPLQFYYPTINPSHKSLSAIEEDVESGGTSPGVQEQQIMGKGFLLIAMGTRVERRATGLQKGWDGVLNTSGANASLELCQVWKIETEKQEVQRAFRAF